MTVEETKTPQTVREVGIELSAFKELTGVHLQNVNEKLEATNRHMESLTSAIEKMAQGKVNQKDFDEHVVWGEAQVTMLTKEVDTINKWIDRKNNSFLTKIGIALQDKVIQIIILVVVVGFMFVLVKFTQPGIFKITP